MTCRENQPTMIDWQQLRACLCKVIGRLVYRFGKQNSGLQESHRVIVWLSPSCGPLMQARVAVVISNAIG
jgi:hypothetical protein